MEFQSRTAQVGMAMQRRFFEKSVSIVETACRLVVRAEFVVAFKLLVSMCPCVSMCVPKDKEHEEKCLSN